MATERSSSTHSFDWRLACEVGVEKAILIGNFQHWIAENERQNKTTHLREGEYWTYWTGKELTAKYPYLKASSVYRWLTELETAGWIKTGRFNDHQLERKTWYGRGERLIAWFIAPISQNEKCNSQNDNSISQNENSNYQNENPISQNENPPIYKDTHNTTHSTTQNTTHAFDDVVDAPTADFQKKEADAGENPSPNPLPAKPPKVPITGSEFRERTSKNSKAYSYAVEQLKLATDQASFEQLISHFLSQQDLQSDDDGEVIFSSYDGPAGAKRHFMNWLNKQTEIQATSNKPTYGNQRSNARGKGNLRPTSLGQSEYRGTGSTCDVEV